MNKVLNIRGPSGSGKTTLVRDIMEQFPVIHNLLDERQRIEGYELYGHGSIVRLVGKYTSPCGGCDTIKTFGEAESRIMRYWEQSHVIYEGLTISSVWQRWYDLSQRVGGQIWCFLDTPVDVCIERVYQRNGGKPIKKENIQSKHTINVNHYEKALLLGEKAYRIDHRNAVDHIMHIMVYEGMIG